jgi:hypothetical protein|tara:strand:+ start:4374 stop:4985 length:612 start_codon:yes stop_codon:yes gene_type:complete
MRTKLTPLIAAAALVAGSAPPASAAVIYFIGQDIPIPTTFAGVSVNLETGDASNATAGAPGADMNFVLGGEGISNDADQAASSPTWQPVRTGPGNSDAVENLVIGAVVGPGSVAATGYGGSANHFGSFISGTKGYLGFSMVLEDATVAYGWAEVTLQSDNTPGVIHAWAYDDTGAEIAVAVPEPTHTLLIALGLSASTLRRRR